MSAKDCKIMTSVCYIPTFPLVARRFSEPGFGRSVRLRNEIPSCGSTHQERHLLSVRPVRRSAVTHLAAPGELHFLGSPAFPLYLSARGGGRRKVVGDDAARAGRYAGGGERDWVYCREQSVIVSTATMTKSTVTTTASEIMIAAPAVFTATSSVVSSDAKVMTASSEVSSTAAGVMTSAV